MENRKYEYLTKEYLLEILEELYKKKPKFNGFINEGNGFIPFDQSETCRKTMKELLNEKKL